MFCLSLSKPTMTRLLDDWHGEIAINRFRRANDMEENGGDSGARSRRESDVSGAAALAQQQREDALCQGCRTEFQHRDIQGRGSNREADASRLRASRFKRHALEDQIYGEELTPVRITDRTTFKLIKILDKLVRQCIRQYLVRCRVFSQDFDTCVRAASVKNI